MKEKETLTVTDVAKLLGVSRTTVYRLIEEGKLKPEPTPFYRRGGPQRIPRAQVDALLHRPDGA